MKFFRGYYEIQRRGAIAVKVNGFKISKLFEKVG